MDQVKIGKFIAAERKRKGYTQKQLSGKLQISNKTVSKWECGNGFPEVTFLLPLCTELDITVNELLSGERVSEEDYHKKAEENMVNLVKEAQENRKKIFCSYCGLLGYSGNTADCIAGYCGNGSMAVCCG